MSTRSRRPDRTPLLLRATLAGAVVLAVTASGIRASSGPPRPAPDPALTPISAALGASAPDASGHPTTSPGTRGDRGTSCRIRYVVTSRSAGRYTAVLTVVTTPDPPAAGDVVTTVRLTGPDSGSAGVGPVPPSPVPSNGVTSNGVTAGGVSVNGRACR